MVPVYPQVEEFTSTNVTANPSITSPVWSDAYNEGTKIGDSFQFHAAQGAGTSCNVIGGHTPLHDNGQLIVSNNYSTSTNLGPTKTVDVDIVHQSGQTAESFYSGSFDLIAGVDPTTGNYDYEREYRWIALPFKWTNSSLPDEQKVTNYKIFSVYKQIRKTISTGDEQITYSYFGNPIILNFAYHNKNHSTDLHLDENPGPDPDDPPFDPSTPMDYDPVIDDTSDLISIPSDPTIGISNAGWVHVYSPSTGGLVNFGAWLFPNPELPSTADPTEIVNYLLLLCQTLANSRLIDYILDCHIIPVTPQVGGSQDIKVGGRTAVGISAPVVTSDYINVSCGSLNIHEYFSGFQDYITTAHLYLPFIGFVDVLPEYWQSGTISVDYKFNVIDGSFMVYIRSASSKSQLAGSVIAQYSGNACMHIPITGINYSNMVSGLVGAAIAAQSGKTASSVLGSVYSAANTVANGGTMMQSNGYNSTAAMLGVRYPYLCIERPVPSIPARYARDKGYPTNITTALSGVTGFTIIEDIDLSGIPLTQGELEELRGLLKEGVYF